MSTHEVHVKFAGKIVFVGFGSIGQGVLPLILRHIGTSSDRITIVTAEDKGSEEARTYGIRLVKERLTRENFRRVLNPLLGRNTEVTQHQRQDALADAAETDEQDPARELDVNLVLVTHDAR